MFLADLTFPVITWVVCAVIGLILVILISKNSMAFSTDVEYVIVDEQGISIKHAKDVETYSIRAYEGYVNGGRKNHFHLVFAGDDGKKAKVYLKYLATGDPLEIGNDLNNLKNTGRL